MNRSQPARGFRRRILLGHGVLMLLMVAVLGWGLLNLLRLGKASDAILRENYKSIIAAEKMRDAIQRMESTTVLLLVNDSRHTVERLADAQQQFLSNLAKAKDNITIPRETEVLANLEREYKKYTVLFHDFLDVRRGDAQAGLEFYGKNLEPCVEAIKLECDRLLETNQTAMTASSDRAGMVAGTAVWSMLIAGIVGIPAVVLFSLWLSARVTRPIHELVTATRQVAAGHYDAQVEYQGNDEFASLARHFNAMVATLREFHEMKIGEILAEKRKNEAILETIDDGILLIDGDEKVVSLNLAAADALGINLKSLRPLQIEEAVKQGNLLSDVRRCLESGQPPATGNSDKLVSIPHNDAVLFFEYSITPFQASQEAAPCVIVLLRNVTRLKELDRLKSEFVMTASHELRTPLTSIEMSVNLLRERAMENLAAEDRELLNVASEEVVRLKHLVNELLDLTKIESGKIDMQYAEVSLCELVGNAVEPFKSQAEKQSVELILDVPRSLPNIRADAGKIAWVLTNLLGNALRYTPAGGHIWVSAEKAGRWIHIYVRDDGAGIAHDKQAKIFDKFVQDPESGSPGGAGLGLAISKEIVRAHRGHIWVESEPGKGSLFTVALPT